MAPVLLDVPSLAIDFLSLDLLTCSVEHTCTKPVFSSVVQQDFCMPPWLLGNYPFAFLDENGTKATCVSWRSGRSVLYMVDIATGSYTRDESFDFVAVNHVRRLSDHNFMTYAVYYAPNNPAYVGSSIPEEKPPCSLGAHGGPTGLETQNLNWEKQYFCRGYVCVSSCYGRAYRLQGNWGITDVSDCIEAVQSPELRSLVDTKRTAIRGESAGG
ncbi:hypothetical protein EDB19DRAFT_1928303 [Suillus lakei]|nr:hypothetical protein EDB19DRAFT_1928303 [Suillus lakei]